MIIDDLIVLGMAVPNEIKDGRKTVCLGGYSEKLGYIRIYPCRVDMGLKRWDIISVEVERNPKDTRHESWKFVNSNPEWESLNQYVDKVGRIDGREQLRDLMTDIEISGVSVINGNHDSLGIVRPSIIHRAYFASNPQYYSGPRQMELIKRPGEEWIRTKSMYKHEPRLEYTCAITETKTGKHNHKVIEWGAYEWMRKNPGNINQYWDNTHIMDNDYEVFLLVGNQANYRTAFVVINIIVMKMSTNGDKKTARQLALF